ncbi:RepA-like replication initiator [Mycobacterium phage Mask]|nr:RepA-like replication initiator [Mycobacterium phage Mask]
MTTREYAKNLFSQWSDEDFCTQPIFDKLLFQVVNGQRAVNAAGIQPINFTRWRKAMRDGDRVPTEQELRDALDRLEARRYTFLDEDTGELLIRSRIRRDELDKQPTMFLAALRILAVIDSPKFAHVMLDELSRMATPEVKGDKDYSKRLRTTLEETRHAAELRLKTLADQYQPAPVGPTEGPSHGDTPGPTNGPTPGGSTGPSPRPGETQPAWGPSQGPSQGPSGSGSGSGSLTSVGGHLGGTREARDDATDPTAGDHPSDEPPTENPADPEPPTRCRRHRPLPADAEIPDCGPCANFRKAHDRWTERQARAQAEARSAANHTRAALITQAIQACDMCDDDGYVLGTTRVCDHVDRTRTITRGMELLRTEMGWTDPDPDPSDEDGPDA